MEYPQDNPGKPTPTSWGHSGPLNNTFAMSPNPQQFNHYSQSAPQFISNQVPQYNAPQPQMSGAPQFATHSYASPRPQQFSSGSLLTQQYPSPQSFSSPQQFPSGSQQFGSPHQFTSPQTFQGHFNQDFRPPDFSTPLPQGWEVRRDKDGRTYFYNTFTMDYSYEHPRARLPNTPSPQQNSRNLLNFSSPPSVNTTQIQPPPKRNVTVFWDFENCAVPNGTTAVGVVSAIRNFALQKGELKHIIAIGDLKIMGDMLRKTLQSSGVSLHDVPSSKKANQSDFAILSELFKFVLDNPPPHEVVLITGDSDFSTIVHTLRNRMYDVVLIHGSATSRDMTRSANQSFLWPNFLLNNGQNLTPSTDMMAFADVGHPGQKRKYEADENKVTKQQDEPKKRKERRDEKKNEKKYEKKNEKKIDKKKEKEMKALERKQKKERKSKLKKEKLKGNKSIYNPLVKSIELVLKRQNLPRGTKLSVDGDLKKLHKKKKQYGFNTLYDYMEAAKNMGMIDIEIDKDNKMWVSLPKQPVIDLSNDLPIKAKTEPNSLIDLSSSLKSEEEESPDEEGTDSSDSDEENRAAKEELEEITEIIDESVEEALRASTTEMAISDKLADEPIQDTVKQSMEVNQQQTEEKAPSNETNLVEEGTNSGIDKSSVEVTMENSEANIQRPEIQEEKVEEPQQNMDPTMQ